MRVDAEHVEVDLDRRTGRDHELGLLLRFCLRDLHRTDGAEPLRRGVGIAFGDEVEPGRRELLRGLCRVLDLDGQRAVRRPIVRGGADLELRARHPLELGVVLDRGGGWWRLVALLPERLLGERAAEHGKQHEHEGHHDGAGVAELRIGHRILARRLDCRPTHEARQGSPGASSLARRSTRATPNRRETRRHRAG